MLSYAAAMAEAGFCLKLTLGTVARITAQTCLIQRRSNVILWIHHPRKDGKFPVTHGFSNGRRIGKLYSLEQVKEQISKAAEIRFPDGEPVALRLAEKADEKAKS